MQSPQKCSEIGMQRCRAQKLARLTVGWHRFAYQVTLRSPTIHGLIFPIASRYLLIRWIVSLAVLSIPSSEVLWYIFDDGPECHGTASLTDTYDIIILYLVGALFHHVPPLDLPLAQSTGPPAIFALHINTLPLQRLCCSDSFTDCFHARSGQCTCPDRCHRWGTRL